MSCFRQCAVTVILRPKPSIPFEIVRVSSMFGDAFAFRMSGTGHLLQSLGRQCSELGFSLASRHSCTLRPRK
ncbi:MAG: hypothetical protein DWB44_07245 [Chloroflexi bacterium]|nr:hypothetical protein [Chloroflexota bacterium]